MKKAILLLVFLLFSYLCGFTQSWSEPIVISQPGSHSCSDFVIDKFNRFHCVWQQNLGKDSNNICYTRSDNYGVSWSTPVAINNGFFARFDKPHIAADTLGNLYVSFDQDPVSSMKICYLKLNYGDTVWSQPVELGYGLNNRIVVDRNNRVYFFWNFGVEKYKYLENETLSGTISVCSSPEPGCSLHDIAVDKDNTLHCVGNRFTNEGGDGSWYTFSLGNWNPYVKLCENTFYESSTSLNSINMPSFVWRQLLPSNPNIMATYFSEIENGIPTEPVLLGERTSYADIAMDYTDKPHIVESQETDSNYQLVHRCRTSSGWYSQIVEDNKTWYIYNNLISQGNHLYWVYDKCDTILNDTLNSYYTKILFRKLDLPAITSEMSHPNNIQTFPNPIIEFMNIQFNTDSPHKILLHIYDLAGRTVYTTRFYTTTGINTIVWNAKNNSGEIVAKGIYFLRLSSELTTEIVKIIKL